MQTDMARIHKIDNKCEDNINANTVGDFVMLSIKNVDKPRKLKLTITHKVFTYTKYVWVYPFNKPTI